MKNIFSLLSSLKSFFFKKFKFSSFFCVLLSPETETQQHIVLSKIQFFNWFNICFSERKTVSFLVLRRQHQLATTTFNENIRQKLWLSTTRESILNFFSLGNVSYIFITFIKVHFCVSSNVAVVECFWELQCFNALTRALCFVDVNLGEKSFTETLKTIVRIK